MTGRVPLWKQPSLLQFLQDSIQVPEREEYPDKVVACTYFQGPLYESSRQMKNINVDISLKGDILRESENKT